MYGSAFEGRVGEVPTNLPSPAHSLATGVALGGLCPALPAGVLYAFRILFIGDVVNAAPFTAYYVWREEMLMDEGGPLPPLMLMRDAMRMARVGTGVQQGAFMQRAALPPIVSFGLSPDEHFEASLQAASKPTPLEEPAALEADLAFAAHVMCGRKLQVAARRE